ncbi:hypothetical protein JHK82_021457 [Glycine max]|nr:hypothetical protein JHK82_021457 [Glycine max]
MLEVLIFTTYTKILSRIDCVEYIFTIKFGMLQLVCNGTKILAGIKSLNPYHQIKWQTTI